MAKSSFNNVRIQLKNDTSENWQNSTLVLLAGEFAVENDTGLFKIGNGTDVFSALPYANDAAQVAKEFNELKDKIGTIPDDKTIIQLIEEAATSGGPEYDDSALKKRISDNEAAIATLTGDGDGSVKDTVAGAIAQVLNGAPEDFDTLKEVSDWIKNDQTGAAKMASDIEALNKKSALIDVLDHRAVRRRVEIGNVPTGTLVNYGQDEVRVMAPSDTVWTANRENKYYMSAKLFAPSNAKYFRESLSQDITDETYYIKKFDSYKNGYNMSYGGDSMPSVERPKGKDCPNSKRVCQISLDGELIKIWDSATEASNTLGIRPSSLSNVCRGKKRRKGGDVAKTAGGYVWVFEKDYDPYKDYSINRPRQNMGHDSKIVLLLSDDGNIMQEFYSINEASRELGICVESVRQICNHKFKNPRFNLKYKSEYMEEQRLNGIGFAS